jgi:hypothetical protein
MTMSVGSFADDMSNAIATFSGSTSPIADAADMNNPDNWGLDISVSNSVPGPKSSIYRVVTQNATQAKIYMSPPLMPGNSYTFVFTTAGQGWGGAAVTTSIVLYAGSANPVTLAKEWYHGFLQAISRAAGQLVQDFTGCPETILLTDVNPTDNHIFVESTLAFPESGYFFVGDVEYYYAARTATSFRDVTSDHRPHFTQHARQVVRLNQRRILPENSRFFLDASGDGTNGVL